MKHFLALPLALVVVSLLAHAQTSAQTAQTKNHPPLVVGPVALNCIDKPCSAATVTANALGSGVNGPLTAQTGMTVSMTKDNWWTGGKVGEVDGLDVFVRQNAPHSDSSGILINVQNQGHGFLSATEFASSIVDPVQNVLTYGIDIQEGVLDHVNGDYIGAVYTADYGALGTGILIQNSSPSASWQNAIQYSKNGDVLFSVDGLGNIAGSSGYFGSFQLNLATPSSSSAPCTAGQIGADAKYIYVCVATNQWKRSALSSF